MRCTNCNIPLPDGARKCPVCGAAVDASVMRCPECFLKLKKGTLVCPKCGCDIKKFIMDEKNRTEKSEPEPTFFDKYHELEHSKKVLVTVSALVVVLLLIGGITAYFVAKRNVYRDAADEFITQTEQAVSEITVLAEEYNKIYDGKWLVQTENAAALESKYADEINALKDGRDSVKYACYELEDKCMGSKSKQLVRNVYLSYNDCYRYVIEKNGKYPGYMSGYNKLHKKFKSDTEQLKNTVK